MINIIICGGTYILMGTVMAGCLYHSYEENSGEPLSYSFMSAVILFWPVILAFLIGYNLME